MPEPRRYKPRPDKHTVISGIDADENCPTIGGHTMIICEDCGGKYAIHCLKCNQQMTNCFPGSTLIDGPAPLGATTRWWSGKMVEINTASGRQLAGTPNHPILTTRGWVLLKSLKPSDSVFSCSLSENVTSADPNINNMPTLISEIYNSLINSGIAERVSPLSVNFHGERPTSYVNIVAATSLLENRIKVGEPSCDTFLSDSDLELITLFGQSQLSKIFFGTFHATNSIVSRLRHSKSLGSSSFRINQQRGFRSISQGDSGLNQSHRHSSSSQIELVTKSKDGRTLKVQPDQIVSINVRSFRGHVYNLETDSGWYIANGIVAHNCGCTVDRLIARHAEEKLIQADKEEWEKKEGVWTPPSHTKEP